jgi:hypothetical protein
MAGKDQIVRKDQHLGLAAQNLGGGDEDGGRGKIVEETDVYLDMAGRDQNLGLAAQNLGGGDEDGGRSRKTINSWVE